MAVVTRASSPPSWTMRRSPSSATTSSHTSTEPSALPNARPEPSGLHATQPDTPQAMRCSSMGKPSSGTTKTWIA
eukprot:scaffold651397_cov27-Prasinocladus_malaysianus.AAC.1